DRTPEQLLPAAAPRRPENELCGAFGASKLDEGGGDVVPCDLVVGAAELLQQPALGREVVVAAGRCQTVAGDDAHAPQLALVSGRHAGGTSDERVATGRAGHRDHDSLARFPSTGHAVVFEILL